MSNLPELPVYHQYPLTLVSGAGALVCDEAGNVYLDMYGGHAVAATGHCHPRVVKAIQKQAEKLLFYSNAVHIPVRNALCKKLVRMGPEGTEAVFLCNSGAEANENALTLARLITNRSKIVSFTGGFHGRTLQTLSLCGIDKYRALTTIDGEPLFKHGVIAPFNDAKAAAELIDKSCAAVIVEPVQGLAGCFAATGEFLKSLRKACDKTGAVLIFDEVQCGTGRCGAFVASMLTGVAPDITTLAKGLGGGFPIGAVLTNHRGVEAAAPGLMGSTFGGGPTACAAALANLRVMESEQMIANARKIGDRMKKALLKIPGVVEVRGAGLLLGAALDRKARPVMDKLLAKYKIIIGASVCENTLRVMPPLNLSADSADHFTDCFAKVLADKEN